MTLTECAISIFIFEGDSTTIMSQKCFLETHDHNVEIVDIDHFDTSKNFKPTDIVLLDMEIENPLNFPVLDMFLSSETRPKLLLTALENQIFEKDDFLSGGPAQILFKPFSPSDLIEAVTELSYISHG